MSWDIDLDYPDGREIQVDIHEEGGTYALGGTDQASLNVTYNYGKHFDFNKLDGRTAEDCIPEMEEAVKELGTERDSDYWKATPGNAGYAVSILLGWARQHPKAVFSVM